MAVSPTNLIFNIVAIPSGVYRYIRGGRMAWPLTWVIIIGTLPGVMVGAVLRIKFLPDPRAFKLFVGGVLLYIGGRMLYELLSKKGGAKEKIKAMEEKFKKRVAQMRQERKAKLAAGLSEDAVVNMYAYTGLAIAPDWPLGILFGIGGTIGMYCGARAQKFVPSRFIRFILGLLITFLAVRYILHYFN